MKKLIQALIVLAILIAAWFFSSCVKELDYPDPASFEVSLEFTGFDGVGGSSMRTSAITFPHVLSNRDLVVIVEQKLYNETGAVIDEAPRTIYNGYFNQLDQVRIRLYEGYEVFMQVMEKEPAIGHIDGLEFRGYSDPFIAVLGMNDVPMHWSTQQSLILVHKILVDPSSGAPVLSVYENCAGNETGISFGPHLYDLTLNLIHQDMYSVYLNELDRGYHIKYQSQILAAEYGKKACSVFQPGQYHAFSEVDVTNVSTSPNPLDDIMIEGTTW